MFVYFANVSFHLVSSSPSSVRYNFFKGLVLLNPGRLIFFIPVRVKTPDKTVQYQTFIPVILSSL